MHENSPFAGIYLPLPDVDPYLQRIGFAGPEEASLPCLKKLMMCHLRSVPFENLDVFHGRKIPSLNTEDMLKKIVAEKRGGYCFELNGLFWRLLESIGFKTWCCAAKIVLNRDYPMPLVHRIVIVELEEKKFFCDVGFGGPVPACPIEIQTKETVCDVSGRKYRFVIENGWTTIMLWKEDRFIPLMTFRDEPCDPVEFVPLNTFCACSPHEPFMHKNMVHIATEEGRCAIDGNVLRITTKDTVSETVLASEQQLREALEVNFGIVYVGELRY